MKRKSLLNKTKYGKYLILSEVSSTPYNIFWPFVHNNRVFTQQSGCWTIWEGCWYRSDNGQGKQQKNVDKIEHIAFTFQMITKSKVCNLNGLTQKEMVNKGEEPNDLGAYFIVKGNERLLRLLIMPRRNYVRHFLKLFTFSSLPLCFVWSRWR